MNYGEKKVDDLRRMCRERGLAVQAKARKQELVAALEAADAAEPIEVEAVAVDDGIIPASVLNVDIEAVGGALVELTRAMDEAATVYGEMQVDREMASGMSIQDIRVCRQGIADAKREVKERRLDVTRMLKAPIDAINEECRKLDAMADDADAVLAEAYDAVIMAGYEAQYQECCVANGIGALADTVPFARFMAMHPRWTARTANPVKTQEKIADEVARIAKDWRTLQSMRSSMRFYDDAEIEFFDSLDVKRAIERNNQRTEEQARIEAMNREREANEAWRRERAARAAEAVAEPEPEPEPAPTRERAAEPAPTPQATVRADGRKRYRFEAWMDDAELASFREWKNACGVGDGWTFREVRNG